MFESVVRRDDKVFSKVEESATLCISAGRARDCDGFKDFIK